MKNFISAVQFLTILPVSKSKIFDPDRMVQYFPVVGLLLGLILALFDRLFLKLWSEPVVAILDVICLVLLTGAFHLDGLGDTADGLLGHRTKQSALAIMKDSRIGVMGLVAIICGLSLKWGGILGLDTHRSLLLVIVPAYARGGILFGIKFLNYGRPEGGTGHAFFNKALKISGFWGLAIPIAISFFMGWRGIWLNFIFIIMVAVILIYYNKRVGCITGDMLGAITEVLESVLFLMVSIEVL
jgi:adenosylcobinamide-GDP ribazoletransferase